MISSFRIVNQSIRTLSATRSFAISAKVVKELREATGAPMLDCKKALENPEVNGNIEKAIDYLRKQGMKRVNKVGGRKACQGLIASYCEGNKGVLIELNSETDFVSRNDYFQLLAKDIVKTAYNSDKTTLEDINKLPMRNQTVEDSIKEAIGKIGENLVLRKVSVIQAPTGSSLSLYTHNTLSPNLSQMASILNYQYISNIKDINKEEEEVKELAHKIAMHIVAANPICSYIKDVPKDKLDKEKEVIREQISKEKKPANIIEKMINGKLNGYYKQVVLTEQPFVLIEGSPVMKKYIESFNKSNNGKFTINDFIRMQVGEQL
ncbi:hypothetical protein WA158_007047 [Blastocystis sp. Blastoise]